MENVSFSTPSTLIEMRSEDWICHESPDLCESARSNAALYEFLGSRGEPRYARRGISPRVAKRAFSNALSPLCRCFFDQSKPPIAPRPHLHTSACACVPHAAKAITRIYRGAPRDSVHQRHGCNCIINNNTPVRPVNAFRTTRRVSDFCGSLFHTDQTKFLYYSLTGLVFINIIATLCAIFNNAHIINMIHWKKNSG